MGAVTSTAVPTLRRRLSWVAAVVGLGVAAIPSASSAVDALDPGVEVAGCAVAVHPGGEWSSYGRDQTNTRTQEAETTIGPLQAATLEPAWTLSTNEATGGAGGDITGTPTVADGCLFVGTNGGWIIAADADSGAVAWTAQVPKGGAINSSVTVADGVVYAGVSRAGVAGGSYVWAVREADGSALWDSPAIDTQPGSDVFASPVLVDAPDGARA